MGVNATTKDWPLISYRTTCCCLHFSLILLCQNLFHKIANKDEALFFPTLSEEVKLAFSTYSRGEHKQSSQTPEQPTVDISLDCSFFTTLSQRYLDSLKFDSYL